jgi:hypothetical protein
MVNEQVGEEVQLMLPGGVSPLKARKPSKTVFVLEL